MSKVQTVLGVQWGDEGKGKLIDILAKDVDIVARFNGGNNAGHTIVVDDQKYALHLIPSGILYPHVHCLLGNGMVIHIPSLLTEIKSLEEKGISCEGRIHISNRAHVLLDMHQMVDKRNDVADKIGTTGKGIGPCYTDKIARRGIRFCDLYTDAYDVLHQRLQDMHGMTCNDTFIPESIKHMILDGVHYINQAMRDGKKILIEGANATMLDIDFGTYPYVTSSSPSIGGVCTGLGIAPAHLGDIHGVVKAYTTRVGEGPFPTECLDHVGEHLQQVGREWGTTTGRKRRCGWLDLPLLQYTCAINGITTICLTKLDVLTGLEELKVATRYTLDGRTLVPMQYPASITDLSKVQVTYQSFPGWKDDISSCSTRDDLPNEAKAYVAFIEASLGIKISCIGVGPGRHDNI